MLMHRRLPQPSTHSDCADDLTPHAFGLFRGAPQVYACFAALGVAGTKDSSSVQAPEGIRALQALPLEDAAVLAVIQQYVCFRQGEVWRDISSQLEEEGVQPTQEDRWVCEPVCIWVYHCGPHRSQHGEV